MSESLHVLLVEDSDDDALLVVRQLRLNGFDLTWQQVQTAETLKRALVNQRWDIVISDYRMPQFTAPDVLKIVQQIQPDLPVIVVSGTIGETAAVELMKAGSSDYLMKNNLIRLGEAVRREVREAVIRRERQQAQTELDRTKERLQLAIEGSGIGLWDWYVQTGTVILNDHWVTLMGYGIADLIPTTIATCWQNIHVDDRRNVLRRLRHHIRHRTSSYECELRVRHQSGGWIWMLVRGRVVEWATDGEPLRLTGTQLDITERKLAEANLITLNQELESRVEQRTEALRERDEQLQDLFENANDLIQSVCLATGKFNYVNRSWKETLGYGDDDLKTLTIFDILHPDCHADCRNLFSQFQSGTLCSTDRLELSFVTRDRRIILVEGSVNCRWENDQPTSVRAIFQNITDRKQAKLALQESQQFLQTVLDSFPLYVFWKDCNSIYLGCNQNFANIIGLSSPAEIIGKTDYDLPWSSQFAPIYQQDDRRIIESGEARLGIVQKQLLDGRQIWVEINLIPIRNLANQVIGILGVYKDISDRKQYEIQLQQSNAELARATRLKDEFLATMSHELRTPLNAILGLSEGLQEHIFGSLNERQQKTIATIERSGRHLLELINDILDLSKIEAGKLELELSQVPIQNLCNTSLSFVKQQAFKKQIQLKLDIPEPLTKCLIEVDDRRFRQSLINLLSNAVKFTPEGGQVRLVIYLESSDLSEGYYAETIAQSVTVHSPDGEEQAGVAHNTFLMGGCERLPQSYVCFSVVDTGIGIAPDNLTKLFQPFVQIDSSLNRQYAGTGLGLALVKRIIELHDGTVTVTSELNQGSCFTLRLPWMGTMAIAPSRSAFPAPKLVAAAAPSVANAVPPNKQVIVIEDSPTAADQMVRYLQEIDLQVTVYSHPVGILGEIIRIQPSVIILDLHLPTVSGWDVLFQLKQHPATQSIPVMVVSIEDEQQRGLTMGAAAYLVKPLTRSEFQCSLQRILEANPNRENLPQPGSSNPVVASVAQPLILLAEDNPANLETLCFYLECRGYRVITANNGYQALELLQVEQPDVVVMDIQMPEMDGLEAIQRIRRNPTWQDLPIIAVTALAMPEDQQKCLNAGANAYLSKPVRLKHLSDMIQQFLVPQTLN